MFYLQLFKYFFLPSHSNPMVSFACEKYEMFLLQFIYEKQQHTTKKNLYTKKSVETYTFSPKL